MSYILRRDVSIDVILNSLSDAIHLIDENLVFIYANDTYINWLKEMDIEHDIIGLTVKEATPFLSDLVFEEYRRALQGETVITNETTVFPDGRSVDTETRKIPFVINGEVTGVFTILRDFTEYNRSKEALDESDNRFKKFLENIDLIAVGLDLDGSIIFCNDHLLSLSGWSRGEVMGKNWFDIFTPDDIRGTVMSYHDSITRGIGVPLHFENQIVTKDGSVLDILWSNTVLRDISGEIVSTASIGEDVTERNRLSKQLTESEGLYRDLSQQLEISNRHLREYSNVVSHELRSPVISIHKMAIAMAEDLRSGSNMSSVLGMLDQIVEKTGIAVTLIDEMLRYSEVSHIDLEISSVRCDDLIPDLIDEIRSDAQADLDVVEKWPIIRGDQLLIRQIFRNLIENGIKFNDSNPKRVELSWENEGDKIAISVKDNGIGIPADILGRIFEPHVRFGDRSGTGMGLAIVKISCDRMGISISVSSEVDRGTTFKLLFDPGDVDDHDGTIG